MLVFSVPLKFKQTNEKTVACKKVGGFDFVLYINKTILNTHINERGDLIYPNQ